MTTREMSIIEQEMNTPEGRRELAAAQGIADAADLLLESFEASELTQDRLATLLGVTPGRVSQVLHGDGNVKVATLARFLAAMGYELRLTVAPAQDAAPAQGTAASRTVREGEWVNIAVGRFNGAVINGRFPGPSETDEWEDQRSVGLRACLR
jgi:transcriptional regulator with XRE-family HTH domain